ncbi:unnamed protein product [Urochloa humidicola]
MHSSWYRCEHGSLFTCCPAATPSLQTAHSSPSPSSPAATTAEGSDSTANLAAAGLLFGKNPSPPAITTSAVPLWEVYTNPSSASASVGGGTSASISHSGSGGSPPAAPEGEATSSHSNSSAGGSHDEGQIRLVGVLDLQAIPADRGEIPVVIRLRVHLREPEVLASRRPEERVAEEGDVHGAEQAADAVDRRGRRRSRRR